MWLDSITEWLNDLIDWLQESGAFYILIGTILLALLTFAIIKLFW